MMEHNISISRRWSKTQLLSEQRKRSWNLQMKNEEDGRRAAPVRTIDDGKGE